MSRRTVLETEDGLLPGETLAGDFEAVRIERRLCLADLAGAALLVAVVWRWPVLAAPGILAALALLLARRRTVGRLALTSERILYREATRCPLGSRETRLHLPLESIAGVENRRGSRAGASDSRLILALSKGGSIEIPPRGAFGPWERLFAPLGLARRNEAAEAEALGACLHGAIDALRQRREAGR